MPPDEVAAPPALAAAAQAPAPAPVVEAAAPAVVEVKPAEPAVVEVKPAEAAVEVKPEPVVETKPAEPAVEAKPAEADTPTLLEAADAKPKPEEKKPGDLEVKPAEESLKTVFQPYVLPEGVKLEEARVSAFNDLLAKPDVSPQERGQALVNMHVAEMQGYADHLAAEQRRVFEETRANWRKQATSDEEMGGSGWNTSLVAIAKMRDLFVAEKDRKAFNDFLRYTGAGDHPQFLKLLYNVARKFDEPAPPQTTDYRPPPDIGKRPANSRRSVMYDNPTSTQNRNR